MCTSRAALEAGELGLRRIVGRDWLVEDGVVSACLNLKCPTIARLMAKLADEAEQPGAHAELMIDALGQALVIELVRYLDRQNQPSAARRGESAHDAT